MVNSYFHEIASMADQCEFAATELADVELVGTQISETSLSEKPGIIVDSDVVVTKNDDFIDHERIMNADMVKILCLEVRSVSFWRIAALMH